MKYSVAVLIMLIPMWALGGVIEIGLDQDASLSESSPDKNYSEFDKFRWVGTNFTGANHQAMFGFDLSNINLQSERVESVVFGAFVPQRHGGGGEVYSSIGIDNNWDPKTVTFESHGNLFEGAKDSNVLDNSNLFQFSFWAINNSSFIQSLAEGYLTMYLYTLDNGSDGTNFHDIAGSGYSNGFTPIIKIALSDNAVSISEPPVFSLTITGILFLAYRKGLKTIQDLRIR